ncbi:hypothetical protein AERO9A_230015 [Aeromonas salmonicida]|nr:hypothetical protein AERO9A_230015 [Aeromonas salmonicida]
MQKGGAASGAAATIRTLAHDLGEKDEEKMDAAFTWAAMGWRCSGRGCVLSGRWCALRGLLPGSP